MASPVSATDVIPTLWSEDWWSEFFRSPGFGAVVAVLAAIIGIITVLIRGHIERRQAKDTREHEHELKIATETRKHELEIATETRKHESDAAYAGHWWDMYRWVLDQLDTLNYDRAALLLDALYVQAPKDAERALVSVAVDLLLAIGQEGGDSNESEDVLEPV